MVQPHCGQVREEPPFDGRSQLIKFVSCFMCFYARLIFLPSADRLLRAHLSMDSIAQCHVLLLLTPVFSSKILIPPKEMVKKIFCLCSPLERAPATTPCWEERHGFHFSVFIWKCPLVPKACQIPSGSATNQARAFLSAPSRFPDSMSLHLLDVVGECFSSLFEHCINRYLSTDSFG